MFQRAKTHFKTQIKLHFLVVISHNIIIKALYNIIQWYYQQLFSHGKLDNSFKKLVANWQLEPENLLTYLSPLQQQHFPTALTDITTTITCFMNYKTSLFFNMFSLYHIFSILLQVTKLLHTTYFQLGCNYK